MAAKSWLLLASLFLSPAAWGLTAAAGRVDITPDLKRDRIYMAGFGATGRRPEGVHDPLYARVLLLSDGGETVAIVGLDLLGFYRNDVEDLRRQAGFDHPGRRLFVAATHTHSGPDTLGLWGPFPGVSGVNQRYHRELKEKIARELRRLSLRLKEARLSASFQEIDPRGLCRDSRNPAVIDPDLAAVSLKTAGGKTLATVVNWACHAEAVGPSNRLITADFPGPLCARVEQKTGGACLFLNGPIGGLLTPDIPGGREDFEEAARIGTAVADLALRGLSRPTARSSRPRLAYESETVRVPIENSRYLLLLPALTFGHRLMDAAGRPLPGWKAYWLALRHALRLLPAARRPWVESEVSRIDLGPALVLGVPGEIFPELVIGGYDGRYRAGWPLIDPSNPNPPDLSQAPKGPYLRDFMRAPVKLVVGLANDELGYIVPAYDFKVRSGLLMLPRLPGHHYEETNSIGPAATRIIQEAAERLVRQP